MKNKNNYKDYSHENFTLLSITDDPGNTMFYANLQGDMGTKKWVSKAEAERRGLI